MQWLDYLTGGGILGMLALIFGVMWRFINKLVDRVDTLQTKVDALQTVIGRLVAHLGKHGIDPETGKKIGD